MIGQFISTKNDTTPQFYCIKNPYLSQATMFFYTSENKVTNFLEVQNYHSVNKQEYVK